MRVLPSLSADSTGYYSSERAKYYRACTEEDILSRKILISLAKSKYETNQNAEKNIKTAKDAKI